LEKEKERERVTQRDQKPKTIKINTATITKKALAFL